MEFSIKNQKLQLQDAAARLYILNNQTASAEPLLNKLAATLKEDEHFTSARWLEDEQWQNLAIVRLTSNELADIEKAIQAAMGWAKEQDELAIELSLLDNKQGALVAQTLMLKLNDATYRFDEFKKNTKQVALEKVAFYLENMPEIEQRIKQTEALLEGINLCKNLANTAPNICTPHYLAHTAKKAVEDAGASAKIIEQDYIQANMGSFWSVAKGSAQAPYLLELHYQGATNADEAPTVLVGKGITFDSGGISLKPGEGMDEMKYDMGGAASVIGTFIAVVKAKLPLNLIAIVPTCENMPDAGASKPGDIVTAMDGTTIEILNTDAEGRLILCDALIYAAQFKPRAIIDVATLTGACIIALGHTTSGVLGNDQALVDALLAASKDINDKAWQLPLFPEYKEQLKSNFADLQNIGGRPAGTITAATFLSHFTEEQTWAHLDIAGTAWRSGKEKGATGRPVPLLWQYLNNLVA